MSDVNATAGEAEPEKREGEAGPDEGSRPIETRLSDPAITSPKPQDDGTSGDVVSQTSKRRRPLRLIGRAVAGLIAGQLLRETLRWALDELLQEFGGSATDNWWPF